MREEAVRVLGVDAGGTMTDTIAVDVAGRFIIWKARTTPATNRRGFVASAQDALGYSDLDPERQTARALEASHLEQVVKAVVGREL